MSDSGQINECCGHSVGHSRQCTNTNPADVKDPIQCPCFYWAGNFRMAEHHPKCDGTGQWKQQADYAGESRNEFERDRMGQTGADNAAQSDALRLAEGRIAKLEAALAATVEKYDKSDNGKCAVCRIGHRLYDVKGKVKTCEWRECLSHTWRAALDEGEAKGEKE